MDTLVILIGDAIPGGSIEVYSTLLNVKTLMYILLVLFITLHILLFRWCEWEETHLVQRSDLLCFGVTLVLERQYMVMLREPNCQDNLVHHSITKRCYSVYVCTQMSYFINRYIAAGHTGLNPYGYKSSSVGTTFKIIYPYFISSTYK